jgi:cytochrome c peroxidase
MAKHIFPNGPLPPVVVPVNNPQSDAKIRLGYLLYFDKRLSKDQTVSCASCHIPEKGFADPRPVSEGVGNQKGGRNSPPVLNAAYHPLQFWDGRAKTLEDQALGPIQNPVEMGMILPEVVDRLKAVPSYVEQFQTVFATEPNAEGIAKAIAAFERTIISTDSPYDRYIAGDLEAMDSAGVRGMKIFNGKAHCTPCHSGPNFSDGRFHNLGVGFKDGELKDVGRFEVTKRESDRGAFRTPGLRSIALSAPYLHDGSEKTLMDVVLFYDRGGNPNPHLSRLILPLNLTADERADLVVFLHDLTGAPLAITEPKLP